MDGLQKLRVEKSKVHIDTTPLNIKKKKHKITWKKAGISCLIIVFIALGWLIYKSSQAFKAISNGDGNIFKLFSKVQADDIKNDNGRTNILILGNGGENHPGGNLTDTIIIASIDLKNKKLALISIPRDLYVSIPGYGKGKINSAYSDGYSKNKKPEEGANLTKETISQTFNIPIHYYIRGDFAALTKLVDTVGGVTINVSKAIYDPYYPDDQMKGYSPFKISAGIHTLDGKTALKYARSRETTNDFDRSRRQQEIIIALKDKMLSAQTLTNPKKISDILSILGDHIHTDIGTPEIKYFSSISKDLSANNIITKVFDNSTKGGLVSDSSTSAGYILLPRSGNFKNMSSEIKEIFNQNEKPLIDINDASGKKILPTNLEKILTDLGFEIDTTTTLTKVKTSSITVKDATKFTTNLQNLKNKLKISTVKTDANIEADFVLTIGSDYGN